MEMGDRNERHKRRFTQILFQEAPSISGDAKEESTASASYATEGVRLKKKKKEETLYQKFYNGTIQDIGTEACH